MLRDYHVDNQEVEFSRPSRKVKACSLAENRPADIFLQLKLMSNQN